MLRRRNALLALSLLVASTHQAGCSSEEEAEGLSLAPQVALPAAQSATAEDEAGGEIAGDENAPFGEYRCVTPPFPIPRPRACELGRPYPRCKWNLPHALESRGSYLRWRNTIPEHRWGRPGLVSLLLASAAEYHGRFADQVLSIGDLDAPGPRHQTHDRGVDVDIYLPGAMITENAGGGRYLENYEGRSEDEIEGLRQRVEELARILAVCSGGQLRIYYNDPVVVERFNEWFLEEGLESPFGEPMQIHNDLHRFHFHMTVTEELPPLPETQEPRAPHPIIPIPTPPAIEGVTTPEKMEEEPGTELAVEPEAGREPQAEPELQTESELRAESESAPETIPEPGSEPAAEPASEPAPAPAPAPASEPASEPAPAPGSAD